MNDESVYQFVDTNILVYAYDNTAGPKRQQAQLLLDDLWVSRQGCLSLQVLQEFYVVTTRKVNHILAPELAAQIVRDMKTWRVHLPDVDDILGAIDLQQRYRISFWDAMIINSAWQLNCKTIWSEDLNAGQLYQGIEVINPFQS
jgi:predicted nucleic acid-binding protein